MDYELFGKTASDLAAELNRGTRNLALTQEIWRCQCSVRNPAALARRVASFDVRIFDELSYDRIALVACDEMIVSTRKGKKVFGFTDAGWKERVEPRLD